jgi:hypothetical protein
MIIELHQAELDGTQSIVHGLRGIEACGQSMPDIVDESLNWISGYGDVTVPIVLFLAVIVWLVYISW